MRLWAAILASFVATACATTPPPTQELVGWWKSDRATSLANLPATVSEKHRKLLEEILGRLVIEYTGDTAISSLDGQTHSGPYDVVGEGPDFVDVVLEDEVSGELTERRIWVTHDRMWIWVDGIGFNEYFERLDAEPVLPEPTEPFDEPPILPLPSDRDSCPQKADRR
jgi:hypothetical protein